MLPAPWNPKQINPALMTSKEYLTLANQDNRSHPDSAYNMTLDRLQSAVGNPSRDGFHLIRRFIRNGVSFLLMGEARKNIYAQRNPDPNAHDPWIKIDGKTIYYTDEEIKKLGLQPNEFSFRIYNDEDQVVASAQDEYGTMLIMTAKEYQGFGLGTIVGKIARTYEPAKTSGGFTSSGARNFVRVHREFVRDALKNGFYSKMVRSGQITMQRVKEIVASAKIQLRPHSDDVDLSSNSPKDWLLFTDLHGTFILYDRKLASLIDNNQYHESFTEKMIKGYVYAAANDRAGVCRIKQFGGDSKSIKTFMLGLAYTSSKIADLPLWVEPEEYDLQGFKYGEENKTAGYSSREVTDGKIIDYREMVDAERRFRKRFDQYDEFKHRLHEMAHSKYQMTDN